MTIFQPNLTFRHGGHQAPGFQVQSENWIYQPDACGRPPVEVQQSMICGTCLVIDSPYITGTAGGDWDLFSPCCPYQCNGTAAGKTTYYSARNCTESYCLTSNESLANNWDQCVKDLARNGSGNGVDVFANQTVDEAYCGRCEFLDRDFLKNGLGEKRRCGFGQDDDGFCVVVWATGWSYLVARSEAKARQRRRRPRFCLLST